MLLALAPAALLALSASGASDEVFVGTLLGQNTVPPVTTKASLRCAVSCRGMWGPLNAATIQAGAPGTIGQAMFELQAISSVAIARRVGTMRSDETDSRARTRRGAPGKPR